MAVIFSSASFTFSSFLFFFLFFQYLYSFNIKIVGHCKRNIQKFTNINWSLISLLHIIIVISKSEFTIATFYLPSKNTFSYLSNHAVQT